MVFEEQPVSLGFYVVIGLIMAGAYFIGSEKRLAMVGRPDERQQKIRGQAYRVGFFLLIFGQIVMSCAADLSEIARALAPELLVLWSVVVCAGMGLVCLWKDAAFTAPEGRRRMTRILGGLTVAEGVLLVRSFTSGDAEDPFVIHFAHVPALAGFLATAFVLANFILKSVADARRDAREVEEEEQE